MGVGAGAGAGVGAGVAEGLGVGVGLGLGATEAPPPHPDRTNTITEPAASHACFVNVILIPIFSLSKLALLGYQSSQRLIFSLLKGE